MAARQGVRVKTPPAARSRMPRALALTAAALVKGRLEDANHGAEGRSEVRLCTVYRRDGEGVLGGVEMVAGKRVTARATAAMQQQRVRLLCGMVVKHCPPEYPGEVV